MRTTRGPTMAACSSESACLLGWPDDMGVRPLLAFGLKQQVHPDMIPVPALSRSMPLFNAPLAHRDTWLAG